MNETAFWERAIIPKYIAIDDAVWWVAFGCIHFSYPEREYGDLHPISHDRIERGPPTICDSHVSLSGLSNEIYEKCGVKSEEARKGKILLKKIIIARNIPLTISTKQVSGDDKWKETRRGKVHCYWDDFNELTLNEIVTNLLPALRLDAETILAPIFAILPRLN